MSRAVDSQTGAQDPGALWALANLHDSLCAAGFPPAPGQPVVVLWGAPSVVARVLGEGPLHDRVTIDGHPIEYHSQARAYDEILVTGGALTDGRKIVVAPADLSDAEGEVYRALREPQIKTFSIAEATLAARGSLLSPRGSADED